MVCPASKVSVRVPGESSSGDSFKMVLFSANEGREPCFQKGHGWKLPEGTKPGYNSVVRDTN